MKKVIIYLLLFFKFNMIYGQLKLAGDAYYTLDSSMWLGEGSEGSGCGYGGLEWLYLQKKTGGTFYLKNNDGSMWQKTYQVFNSNHNIKFTDTDPITSFRIKSNHRVEDFWGSCYTESLWEHSVGVQKVADVTYQNTEIFARWFNGWLNLNTYPVINLINTDLANNIIGDDDSIIIPEINDIEKKYYFWQYSASPTGPWIDLPANTSGKNFLQIKSSDFLPNSLIDSYFYIRVTTKVSHANEQGKIIALKYRKSAPHILSVVPTSPKCYKETDGSVIVNFDRALLDTEILGYNLFNIGTNADQTSSGALTGNPNLNLSNDRKSMTIKNLPAGKYRLNLGIGAIDGHETYTQGEKHKIEFEINEIPVVTFKLTKTDIWCHGGQDGVIKIEANGGNKLEKDTKDGCKGINGLSRYCFSLDNGLTWKGFDTEFSHTLMGLTKETYTIQVRDWKGCNALQPNGAILKLSETIQQPQEAVSLSYTSIKQPTFYGGTNGQLVVAIKGGTPFDDHSYAYEWKNSKGVLQTNITPYYDAIAKVYYLTLTGIPSDTYTLTVRDKNYTSATNKDGCTVANSTQFLNQPDPIVVKLNVLRSISCNVTNVFGNEADLNPVDGQRDESQDGILQATVTGGVPFTGSDNNGLPYKYIWSKQKLDGSWEIWNDQDATAQYLNHGNYSLNVEDKNGIRLGIYVNNVISQETPVIQFMPQPSKLELQFQKSDISCSAGNNGWITAIPKGGTPPYTYEWTTGATTAQITNLIANNYFVKVVDAKGCFVQGSMLIDQPNGVVINGIVTSPTCHDGVDGSIITTVTGGTPPYTYSWSTGGNTKDIVSLTSGDYQLTVVDSKGCTYYKNFKLDNPDPIVVNLGGNRTLCNGQQLDLDISIPDPQAQYNWTSTQGFSSNSAKVSLTQADTYTAKVISSKGCLGEDSFVLKTSNVAISSEFFLTSQAYLNDEVILINASNPLGENTSWEIPNTVTIVNQNEKYIVLKFTSLGSYTISLKQTQGDCYALYSKTINVEPKLINPTIGNEAQPFITEFLVTPNPSNGDFQTIVKLAESSPIKLRLYPINGQQPILEKSENGQKSYVLDFNSSLAAGTYALILETAKETLVKKIIIY
ncbi:T9SS C-terminal target domain-containing protein [Flavobacterium columnare]|uniref:T9SS C-terminal target domain-containing protein n=1 Tax=Flavobacterium columnare TaxID=996 RepID=A0A437UD55_9FLAO|nr:T9SS type A sorting domain-containing protein [Flavobacterium columnare]RVU91576.1 T9SS C-terminal target domain-containing protein [Flavobacterium columnare]